MHSAFSKLQHAYHTKPGKVLMKKKQQYSNQYQTVQEAHVRLQTKPLLSDQEPEVAI